MYRDITIPLLKDPDITLVLLEDRAIILVPLYIEIPGSFYSTIKISQPFYQSSTQRKKVKGSRHVALSLLALPPPTELVPQGDYFFPGSYLPAGGRTRLSVPGCLFEEVVLQGERGDV
ncbi:hypothetical protein KM043_010351 [Ampulex compressa]|nr:hypothetical protein KM043_010351 [Ampulex compressa]